MRRWPRLSSEIEHTDDGHLSKPAIWCGDPWAGFAFLAQALPSGAGFDRLPFSILERTPSVLGKHRNRRDPELEPWEGYVVRSSGAKRG